ncbi:hypothetical protein [uncultured Clostridium sp.]|uniref:hypothetical protein n=1 Tax=uncultured Clostridium sp. TaxID=59620 RepID=UPI00262FEE00|nr:hypothetical protein [uncultured Clostridium sp.]
MEFPGSGSFYATQTGDTLISHTATHTEGINNTLHIDASNSSNRYGTYQGVRPSVIGDHIAAVMWKRVS